MSIYECTTVGCTLGDCPNCRYVAEMKARFAKLADVLAATVQENLKLARALADTHMSVGSSSVETGDAK
jgi:hypothetical protein